MTTSSRFVRPVAMAAVLVGLWIALFPFERPIPVGRPDLDTPLILETTPTIDCGAALFRLADDTRHDGACKNVARVRTVVALVLVVGGSVVWVRGRARAGVFDEL